MEEIKDEGTVEETVQELAPEYAEAPDQVQEPVTEQAQDAAPDFDEKSLQELEDLRRLDKGSNEFIGKFSNLLLTNIAYVCALSQWQAEVLQQTVLQLCATILRDQPIIFTGNASEVAQAQAEAEAMAAMQSQIRIEK